MSHLKLYIALMFFGFTFFSHGQSIWVAPDSANSLKNPVAENSEALVSGKTSFEAICFVCHGNQGKGDGLNAPNLERPPADLTAATVQAQSDGALFWKISEGNPPMLSFKYSLSEEQRWQLVHYIRELARLYPPQAASELAMAKKSGENTKAAQLGISGNNQDQSISTFESKGYLITDNYFISTIIGALVVMLITLVVLIYTLMVVTMAVKN